METGSMEKPPESSNSPRPSYSRKARPRPFVLTLSQLAAFLEKLRTLTDSANQGSAASERETLALFLPTGEEIEFRSGHGLDEIRSLDEAAVVGIKYYFYRGNGNITSIWITCADDARHVMVAGDSRVHVDSLMTSILAAFESGVLKFAGDDARGLYRSIAIPLSIFVTSCAIPILASESRRDSALGWALAIFATLALVGVFLPWKRWRPGFAVYRTDRSWAVRHAGAIGLWGLVLGALSIVITLLLELGKK